MDTGGSNVQFAIHPETGRMVIIEMNPRVSRSSALASKATGFPIAKIAAKLAVGYRLDEIPNDITRKTPACFEPTIDYVVVKIPRWQFEKFPGADPTLGTQMKSVGEVMAIGRTFKQALAKGMRSLETGKAADAEIYDEDLIRPKLITPTPDRLDYIRFAFAPRLQRLDSAGDDADRPVVPPAGQGSRRLETELEGKTAEAISREEMRRAKRDGISDRRLAQLLARRPADDAATARSAWASAQCSTAWIPAPPSSRASRRTFIPATNRSARRSRLPARKS